MKTIAMKKIATILLMSSSVLFAQESTLIARNGFLLNKEVEKPYNRSKAEAVSGVFNEWLDFNSGYEAYWTANSSLVANNLFPDSTVLVQYSTGFGSPWIHKIGQVFDMKSLPLSLQYSNPFSRTESYQIDSIQIGLLYNRVNLNPNQFDTVVVEVVLPSSTNLSQVLQFSASSTVSANLSGGTSPIVFPEFKWSHASNSTPGVVATYKIPIGDSFYSDTTQNGLHFLSLAANLPITASMDSVWQGVFGISYWFKPGYSWVANTDTLGGNINALRFLSWELNGQGTYPSYLGDLQTAHILPIDVKYNQAGSWNNRYIPSYAYMGGSPSYSYEDHLVYVKVSQTNSIGLNDGDILDLLISPNPANEYLKVQLPNAEDGTLRITDVCGRLVKNIELRGEQFINVGISELKEGIYYVSIAGSGFVQKFQKL
jgi:hypothetical protein